MSIFGKIKLKFNILLSWQKLQSGCVFVEQAREDASKSVRDSTNGDLSTFSALKKSTTNEPNPDVQKPEEARLRQEGARKVETPQPVKTSLMSQPKMSLTNKPSITSFTSSSSSNGPGR